MKMEFFPFMVKQAFDRLGIFELIFQFKIVR